MFIAGIQIIDMDLNFLLINFNGLKLLLLILQNYQIKES